MARKMTKLYRFIRIGPKPVSDGNNSAFTIRACFEFCTDEVKRELDEFLRSEHEQVVFDFDDNRVIIKREDI
jgi:hypothetical protein